MLLVSLDAGWPTYRAYHTPDFVLSIGGLWALRF
jgi:hypothetical protein